MKIEWICMNCRKRNITDVGGPEENMISELIEFKAQFNPKEASRPKEEFVVHCSGCGTPNKVPANG